MASMVYLRSRPRSFLRASAHYCSSYSRSLLFSSSTSPPDFNHGNPQNTQNNQSNTRSSFNNLKSDLRDGETNQRPPRKPFSFSQGARSPPNQPSSNFIDEIRNNLKGFRSNVQAPQSAASAEEISFQEQSEGGYRPADRCSSPLSLRESLRITNVSEIENKHLPQPNEGPFAGLRETLKMAQQSCHEKDRMNSAMPNTQQCGTINVVERNPLNLLAKSFNKWPGGQPEDEFRSAVPSPLLEAPDDQVEEISPAATEISADHQLTNRDENLPVAPSAPSSPRPKRRKRNVVKRVAKTVAIGTIGKEENVMPSDSLVSSHLQPGLGESDLRKLETPKTDSLSEKEYRQRLDESAILIDGRNSIDWVRHYFEDIEEMHPQTIRSLNEEKDKRRQNDKEKIDAQRRVKELELELLKLVKVKGELEVSSVETAKLKEAEARNRVEISRLTETLELKTQESAGYADRVRELTAQLEDVNKRLSESEKRLRNTTTLQDYLQLRI